MAGSGAEPELVKLADATDIPVVTSTGGKGTIPNSHPLCYRSCFRPRGERQEMNQVYDVMASVHVVIGISAHFSPGNLAGETSTLININIDDTEVTGIQANTWPLHGDAEAIIDTLIPMLAALGADARPPPSRPWKPLGD